MNMFPGKMESFAMHDFWAFFRWLREGEKKRCQKLPKKAYKTNDSKNPQKIFIQPISLHCFMELDFEAQKHILNMYIHNLYEYICDKGVFL